MRFSSRASVLILSAAAAIACGDGGEGNFDREPDDGVEGGADGSAMNGAGGSGRAGEAGKGSGGRASGGRASGGRAPAGGGSGGRAAGGNAADGGAFANDGGPDAADDGGPDGGVGDGSPGAGGAEGDGGSATGGARNTGGAATGGASAGGAATSGGAPSTGGAQGAGGAGAGGAQNTGGAATTGGAPGAGGSASCGGDPNPSATTPCDTDAECCASGRVCGQIVAGPPVTFQCAASFEDGADLGEPCTGPLSGNDACQSGICSGALGLCTKPCERDADCGDPDFLCRDTSINSTPVGFCVQRCTGDRSCFAGQMCVVRESTAARNRLDKYCRIKAAGSAPGTTTSDPGTCDHGQTVIIGQNQYCTAPCDTAADCPAAVPKCQNFSFLTPGTGTTVQSGLCTK